MQRWVSAARAFSYSFFISGALACGAAPAQEAATETLGDSQWAGFVQFGTGYDTNANASTREQEFLGFTLDPRFTKAESVFGELTLGADHSGAFGTDRGLNSSLRVAHRANPDAPFADQTVTSLGVEAVWARDAGRFSVGVSGYSDWLDGENHARAANVDLGISHRTGDQLETALTVRTSRLGYAPGDLQPLDVDRYLIGLSLTRLNLGKGAGRFELTLLNGHDAPRRVNSPFGNHRFGAQLAMSWPLPPNALLYAELSGMRARYGGDFFDLRRRDDQYEAAVSCEFMDWPAARWSVTPQLLYERNDSTVSLFEYDRIEVALYIGRQL